MLEIRTEPLPSHEWLGVIGREYFTDFLKTGGAAAKFVVGDDSALEEIQTESAVLAHHHGLIAVSLNAGATRLHMIQDVLFGITKALPWDRLAQQYLEILFARHEHPWPNPGEAMGTVELAQSFGISPGIMTRHRDQWLSRDLWDDPLMARDFRAAAIALCLARLDRVTGTPAHQWLHGEKPPMQALRGVDIAARITRGNARAMLVSLCYFLRKAGVPGLLLTLDLRAATRTGRAAGDTLRYTTAAVMDLYEVLRALIDDLEHLPGLFVLGLADHTLIAGEPKRTLDTYKALEMRIWPDVRPGDRQNPLAPLVMVTL